MGRRIAANAGHQSDDDAASATVQRRIRRRANQSAGPFDSDMRGGGRPAKRPVRPVLPYRRHGQEYLWHRLLHADAYRQQVTGIRSEEQTSQLQSLMRTSYAGYRLKKKKS